MLLIALCFIALTSFADRPNVYAAGPLFNEPERAEMRHITEALETDGFDVFLPHRDGLEFAKIHPYMIDTLGLPKDSVLKLLGRSIDALDVYQVASADALVMNINGRVPDEGAIVELTIAWLLGKATVIYRSDIRSLTDGINNPLIMGRAQFREVGAIEDIPAAVRLRLEGLATRAPSTRGLPRDVRDKIGQGAKLWRLMQDGRAAKSTARLVDSIIKMFGAECEIDLSGARTRG